MVRIERGSGLFPRLSDTGFGWKVDLEMGSKWLLVLVSETALHRAWIALSRALAVVSRRNQILRSIHASNEAQGRKINSRCQGDYTKDRGQPLEDRMKQTR